MHENQHEVIDTDDDTTVVLPPIDWDQLQVMVAPLEADALAPAAPAIAPAPIAAGTAVCMHWHKSFTRTDTLVTATCDACGATDQLPRCQGTNVKGGPCSAYVLDGDDGCKWHSTEALAARAEREAAKAAKAVETEAQRRERATRKSVAVEAKRCPAVKADGSRCRAFKTKSGLCMFHAKQQREDAE